MNLDENSMRLASLVVGCGLIVFSLFLRRLFRKEMADSRSVRLFFYFGALSGIVLGTVLLAGWLGLEDLLELHKRMVESCPFCMRVT